jgi:hypothetical protein
MGEKWCKHSMLLENGPEIADFPPYTLVKNFPENSGKYGTNHKREPKAPHA